MSYESSISRKFYLCGIPVMTFQTSGDSTSVRLFGRIPLCKVKRTLTKFCVYLGPCELFKVRCSGVLPVELPSFALPGSRHDDGLRRFYFNIGRLHETDAKTGIQRVARSLLLCLCKHPPEGYTVVPVYCRRDRPGFFCAADYVRKHMPEWTGPDADLPVDFATGDMLFSPIPDLNEALAQQNVFKILMRHGVKVISIVHDVIPLTHPQYCVKAVNDDMARWLPLVAQSSGMIAVSQYSLHEFLKWMQKAGIRPRDDFFTGWFHLGADIRSSAPSSGIPEEAESVFVAMRARPSLLEVSTVEARKGYAQALAAFERLWARGVDVNFVIVGKAGWNVEELIRKLEKHPELGRRLFWLKGISDEYLERVYQAASGVLMPSEVEGFGLAVIEGAYHGKPLILRDIPVFREIAGDNATYFSGLEPEPLADVIEQWLKDFEQGAVLPSTGIRPLTWEESARMLLSRLPLQDKE